ncbi:MAG: hypothetical protein ACI38Q_07245 [Candidatus Bruticola sp.]
MKKIENFLICRLLPAVLAISVLLTGCSFFGYFAAELSVSVTNDKNHILAVEGRSNMPDETPVSVSLREDKDIIAKGNALVKNGNFAVTLDLSTAPGNCALTLEVILDPSKGPVSVQKITGQHGEFLYGKQVEEVGNYCYLTERLRLVLPMSRRMVAIRRAMAGDYGQAVVSLEDILAVEPNDEEIKAWLAYSLLSRDPHEDKLGSQAYELLGSINVKKLNEPIASYCSQWQERLVFLKAKSSAEAGRKAAIAKNLAAKAALKTRLEAGKFLGGVYLGTTARKVYELAIPDKYPVWSGDVVIYHMPDRNVEVYFDGKTSEVVEVHTADSKFAAKNNVGVGSTLGEVAGAYPSGRLTMGQPEPQSDGNIVTFGEYSCPEGLIFYIKRLSTGDGLILSENVRGLSVIPPFEWDNDNAEPDEEAAISADKAGEAIVNSGSYPRSKVQDE